MGVLRGENELGNAWSVDNITGLLLTWLLNPAYTLYEQCTCGGVSGAGLVGLGWAAGLQGAKGVTMQRV